MSNQLVNLYRWVFHQFRRLAVLPCALSTRHGRNSVLSPPPPPHSPPSLFGAAVTFGVYLFGLCVALAMVRMNALDARRRRPHRSTDLSDYLNSVVAIKCS